MSDRVRLGIHFLLVAVLTSTIGTVPAFAADPSGASTAAPAEATASGPAPDVAPGPAEPSQPAGNGEPVIVLLRDRADVDTAVARARVGTPFRVSHVFRHALKGYAATLTPAQRAFVAHDPAVEAIVPDSPVQLEAQSIPWGVRRVGAV
ncbi:MAG: protease inhibitor I9 family protein, partial [Chloroflexota bacterium]